MPRNSYDNSYARYSELKQLAAIYSLKNKSSISSDLKQPRLTLSNLRSINKIDKTCRVLRDPFLTIIKNEFFEKKELYWWLDYYSKTTFYRLRRKAIDSFLRVYKLQ